MLMSPIRELMFNGPNRANPPTAIAEGMKTLYCRRHAKSVRGITTFEEVYAGCEAGQRRR